MKLPQIAVALAGTFLLSAPLAGCSGPEVEDDSLGTAQQPWVVKLVRGHEDLLRLAIAEAPNLLPASQSGWAGAIQSNFASLAADETCGNTWNQLLVGNCATDFPDETMLAFYGELKADWHTSGKLQSLHALRNWTEVDSTRWVLNGAATACFDIRERIITATEYGLARYNAGDYEAAQYWWGHATHTLQDSFSPAHTERSGQYKIRMTNICTYGYEVDGVCYHSTVSSGDFLSLSDSATNCADDPYGPVRYDCISLEAQAAVKGTVGYLRAISELLAYPSTDARELLNDMFDYPQNSTVGYLQCDQLSDDYVDFAPYGKNDELDGDDDNSSAAGCSVTTSGGSGSLPSGLVVLLGLFGAVFCRRSRGRRS